MAQLVQRDSQAWPGGTVTFSIWVWSTVPARQVIAHVASNAHLMRTPRYTLCPVANGTKCSIGTLPANQAFELLVTDRIRTAAIVGDQITLTVTVQATALSPATATITTIVSQASASPTPSPSITLPPVTFPQVPITTVTPGSLASLFPVVTPAATPATAGGHRSSRDHRQIVGLTSSTLPLDPRLIGGQLAGLAVLAAAITMVVARLSLRTPQPAGPAPATTNPATTSSGIKDTPPAEQGPIAESTASAQAQTQASAETDADAPEQPTT